MAAGALERWFHLRARGTDALTEVRAGAATFMVMAYIIFVNPIVLGYVGVPGLDGKGLPFAATLTVTCPPPASSHLHGRVDDLSLALAPAWAKRWLPRAGGRPA